MMRNLRLDDAFALLQDNKAYQYWLLAAITLLAAVLRFYKLGEWSFWIDEIFTINHARLHFNDLMSIIKNLPLAPWLPFSVILENFSLKIFGISEWSARLVAALIGIVSIPILYFPTRNVFGIGAALILSFLLSISSWHLNWSQNARFYTSLLLLYTLAAFAFFFFLERGRLKYILYFYVLLYFALSERNIAILIFPVIFFYIISLWIFRFERPPGLKLRNLLYFIAPMFVMVLYEIARLLTTGGSTVTFFITDFVGQQFDDPLRLMVAIVFNISLPILALSLVGGLYLLLRKSRAGLFFFLSASLPVLILVLANPFMFTKDRFVFITLPSWLILVAITVKELISRNDGLGKLLASGILFVLLVEAAGSNLLYYRVNNGNRLDWRTAFEIIKEKSQPDDAYVSWWPQFGPYYLDHEIIPWKDIRPEMVINSGKRYWFLVDWETVWGNNQMREWVQENAELIDVLYLRRPEDNFNLRIYLYDPAKDHLSKEGAS